MSHCHREGISHLQRPVRPAKDAPKRLTSILEPGCRLVYKGGRCHAKREPSHMCAIMVCRGKRQWDGRRRPRAEDEDAGDQEPERCAEAKRRRVDRAPEAVPEAVRVKLEPGAPASASEVGYLVYTVYIV